MLVKIGNEVHDSDKEPIMITLTKNDKEIIALNSAGTTLCLYPSNGDFESIKKFMGIK